MANQEENKKKPSFLDAFNRPRFSYTPVTDSGWGLMKSKMKNVEFQEGETDGSDVFEVEKPDKEIKRDGRDGFWDTETREKSINLPKDNFQDVETREKTVQLPKNDLFFKYEKEEDRPSKADKWERDFKPIILNEKDSLVRASSGQIELISKEVFIESSSETEGLFQKESKSALYLQINDIAMGFEKRVIEFEKRDKYLFELEHYIKRKKKSFEKFYSLKEPGMEKIKFLLNRGFEVFSQALNELKVYLRDDSSIHLTLAKELACEGNSAFEKAKKQFDMIKGNRYGQ